MADLESIITLEDDDGGEMRFDFLDLIDYQEDQYAVLYPIDEEDTDEVVILKVEDLDEESDNYIDVEDEETLNAVFALFKERNKDKYDFAE
jgi:uncharacterized protein YrzB (UPF0473 family)